MDGVRPAAVSPPVLTPRVRNSPRHRWGVWHGLADYWGTHAEFGALGLPRIALWTAALTAYRVLIVWVSENTESLLVAQLMHASFTGSQGLLVPALSPTDHFLWYGSFTVALWVIVAVLASRIRNRGIGEEAAGARSTTG